MYSRIVTELGDFGSFQLMHTISGNEHYFLMSEDILDKVWKHANVSERAINVNDTNFELFDFQSIDELVSMKIYISPTALNDGDAADSFNLKVQKLIMIISLKISDVARFVDMNILVPRGHHYIEKGKDVFALRGKLYDYKIMYKAITHLILLPKEQGSLFFVRKSMMQKNVEVGMMMKMDKIKGKEEENYREERYDDFMDESADKIDKGDGIRKKKKLSELEKKKREVEAESEDIDQISKFESNEDSEEREKKLEFVYSLVGHDELQDEQSLLKDVQMEKIKLIETKRKQEEKQVNIEA
ncbi:MAG: hypothetical protein EZS28_007791 [Streblomastix strix]|uniref:FACT complex subunit SSRP1-like first PH domain-containing protein n=1 Tax=Streblomastix strix TaxID=222440 RepID=A0A5J4WPR0_9EUKA|nr:MAG: hypothetical protein EZS28_007791 [Streblomastix strix]